MATSMAMAMAMAILIEYCRTRDFVLSSSLVMGLTFHVHSLGIA